ncbi:MAG: HAMP domain-containing histidine kinase [Candidatus Riflebacteria bacterium]|nr:HAMP domain-containing histidine kinase [Candidatus Riflebacteria bacterium]
MLKPELLRQWANSSEPSPLKLFRLPAVLALTYLVLGALYIFFSGRFASSLAKSIGQLEFIERYKGYAFIFVSAVGLYLLSTWLLRRIQQREHTIHDYRNKIVVAYEHSMAGLFASSIAHDINNVMMGVEFVVDGLNSQQAPLEDHLVILRKANENLKQLAGSLGKVSGHHMSDSVEAFDLAALARESIGIAALHNKVRKCIVDYSGPESLIFTGRKILFSQMLLNLIINAGDATDHHGKIMVKLFIDSSELVIEVCDDGPGIPEDMRETVMQPLFTTKSDGHGLGLISLDVCAKVHNGSVKISQSPMGGAAFEIRLPK